MENWAVLGKETKDVNWGNLREYYESLANNNVRPESPSMFGFGSNGVSNGVSNGGSITTTGIQA